MIPQDVYGVFFFFGGCIVFSLMCWWLCHYVDSEKNYVARRCRRKVQEYYRQEQRLKRHYKKRKDLGKML